MNNSRIFYLDYIRILACMMVIVMHAPIPKDNMNLLEHISLLLTSYFMAPCIGLFFMVSGALLLPVKYDLNVFLKRRLTKIIYPTLFWTIFYIIFFVIKEKEIVFSSFIKSIFSIPFTNQGNGILWFMYTLIGLYLLAPVLSSWLIKASKKEIEFYLMLWCISLCYPILNFFLFINETDTGILYYFSGYAGYLLLGYYLNRFYKESLSRKAVSILLSFFILLSILPPVFCFLLNIEIDFYSLFWYLSVSVVTICLLLFLLLQHTKIKFSAKIRNLVMNISKLSLGIYLIPRLIMRAFICHIAYIKTSTSYIRTPVSSSLTLSVL